METIKYLEAIETIFMLICFVQVAEILVKAFPSPEDVRVSLRDKYNDLYQRLRHCTVKGTVYDKDKNNESKAVFFSLKEISLKNENLYSWCELSSLSQGCQTQFR